MRHLATQISERTEQLALLGKLLAGARQGRGRVALLSGPVASGKTALLTDFGDTAPAGGAVLLDCTGDPAESALPFALARRIFESAPLTSSARAEATRLLDEAGAEPEAHEQMLAMPKLVTLLLGTAKEQPLVIAVDDVHASDPASLRFLLYLIRRIRHARVLVVLSEPARPGPEQRNLHAELAHLPHCTRLRIRLLSPAGTAELLEEFLPPAAAAAHAAGFHDLTGGSPLLLRGLIEDHLTAVEAGESTPSVVRGEHYAQAVIDCLRRLGPEAPAVARGMAVLGEAGTPKFVAQLLDIPGKTVEKAAADLSRSGLLHQGAFRDPRAGALVLDAMPAAAVTALRTRAAEMFYAYGFAAPEVARHLVAAGGPGAAWTVPVLQEAAEYALADGDTEFARHALALAQESSQDDQLRASLKVKLAGVTWRANPADVDVQVAQLLPGTAAEADATAGQLSTSDLVVTVAYLAWSGRLGKAAGLLDTLEQHPDWSGDEERTALTTARHWLAMLSPSLRMPDGLRTPAGAGDAIAGAADTAHRHTAWAVTAALSAQGRRADAVSEATRVLQRYQLNDGFIQPLVFALWALVYTDRLDLAQPWCERLLTESADRHAPVWQALLMSVRAEIALRQGDLPAARRHAEWALSRMSPKSWGLGSCLPLATLVQAHTGMGGYEEARTLLGWAMPKSFDRTLPGLHYRRARGRWNLAMGRYHVALEDFLGCGQLMEEWGCDVPELVPWRLDAAETWLALGRADKARELAEEQLARSPEQLRGVTLRVLGSATGGRHGLQHLHDAAELLEDGGDRVQLALTLAELGRAYRSLDNVNRARMLVRKAWHVAKASGAEPLYRQLIPGYADGDGEFDVPVHEPVPQQDTASLTEAESRVAMLAAHGHTNREIAAKLYVTVSTVEQHLTRIYRKLNVKRRRDLPTKLSASDLQPEAIPGPSVGGPVAVLASHPVGAGLYN
ncbi:AAA family ATPase [Kitasatospora sp. NPDC091335]|uniref:helix-turn-helix transcriptional regulator n=1 Tax=Kitasatospora sp. NPDC091335 TaxID=3364085 RepID=UPI003808205F